MADEIFCERCREKLNPKTAVMLELDQDTALYHDPDVSIPAGHTSQGGFWFGRACAKAVLAAGGSNRESMKSLIGKHRR